MCWAKSRCNPKTAETLTAVNVAKVVGGQKCKLRFQTADDDDDDGDDDENDESDVECALGLKDSKKPSNQKKKTRMSQANCRLLISR